MYPVVEFEDGSVYREESTQMAETIRAGKLDEKRGAASRHPRLGAVLREEERVTALELFFDLVFVLAITQCTALMAGDPTWQGLARGLLVLAVLWWAWVGYSWLTSVVNPEEGVVRLAMFGAMAAMLVCALCVPEAFAGSALLFAVAYAVRAGGAARPVRAGRPRRPGAAPLGRRRSPPAPRSASG